MVLVTIDVRSVTSDEVNRLAEDGWTTLPGLISPSAAAELRTRAQAMMGELGDARPASNAGGVGRYASYRRPDQDDELFRDMALHEQMGRNAAALFQTDNGIRLLAAVIAAKLPTDLSTSHPGKGETEIHQDGPREFDNRGLTFWLALHEMSPDMGTLRFLTGSHRFGLMEPPYDRWKCLDHCRWSEPLKMRPGDATVHCTEVVHRAPQNSGADTRWACLLAYFPANSKYNGMPSFNTYGLFQAGELKIGEPLDHPDVPLVYAGNLEAAASV